MCSISTNKTADKHLEKLERSGDGQKIEKRLFHMAEEANETQPGALDNPANLMKRMPPALRDARKYTYGRHRIFYVGRHTKCSYRVFYIKMFKKTGVKDEDDKQFQKTLEKALNEPPPYRTIQKPPDDPGE